MEIKTINDLETLIENNKDKGLDREEWLDLINNVCEGLQSNDECDAFETYLILLDDDKEIWVVVASYFSNIVCYKFIVEKQ